MAKYIAAVIGAVVVSSDMACAAEPPTAAVVDRAALAALTARAKETGSDSVVVYRNGEELLDYHSSKPAEPMYLMSATKSVVALVIGVAIAEGKIKSIDEPVSDFYPELNQGRKKLLTIRQLLSMTTGIQHNGFGDEIYAAPDSVKLALAAELQTTPGAAFSYNNKSINLLAGIIRMATGEPLDTYADEKLFAPMQFDMWRWEHDNSGTPNAFADLALQPKDFAKLGLLAIQRGQWQGKQLVPAAWVDQLGLQSQPYEPLYGLLWWRLSDHATGIVSRKHLDDLLAAWR